MASPQRAPQFRAEMARRTLTSGLPRRQVAADLGAGVPTLNNWDRRDHVASAKPAAQSGMQKDLGAPSKKVRMLGEEREVSKRVRPFSAIGPRTTRKPVFFGAKQVRFALIAKNTHALPVGRLREIMDVSPRGCRACCAQPLRDCRRRDLVVLAHIPEQFALSLGRSGRPRRTEELKEAGDLY